MKAQQAKSLPAVLSRGLFFVIKDNVAAAHLVPDEVVTRFYERVRIALDCRDPDTAMRDTIYHVFRVKGAQDVLPAGSFKDLVALMDDYKGPAQDSVRALAAGYLAGVPWNNGRLQDPGAHDRIAAKPKTPEGPAGVNPLDALAAQLEMVPS